jgi:hypothetical protein
MRPENMTWLKEFVAAERGVNFNEINDSEIVSRYRRHWLQFFVGLVFVIGLYFVLKFYFKPEFASGLAVLVMVVGLGFEFRNFISSARLKVGSALLLKRQVAKKLNLEIDQISDASVLDFSRRNIKAVLLGLSFLAFVSLLVDVIWPNTAIELFILVVFYSSGILALRANSREIRS